MRLRRLFFDDGWPECATASMRRAHAAWLSRALHTKRSASFRIPIRRVEAGGFDDLIATHAGRAWADQWWTNAMQESDALLTDT